MRAESTQHPFSFLLSNLILSIPPCYPFYSYSLSFLPPFSFLLSNLILSISLLATLFIPIPSPSFLHSHSFFLILYSPSLLPTLFYSFSLAFLPPFSFFFLILFPAFLNPFNSQSSLSIPYYSLFWSSTGKSQLDQLIKTLYSTAPPPP